ncbi:LytR/AlgR family response regulator transcription factor [Oleiharenicola lentus]|uniref:LytR/AlgR family response regulator transcription factor n=1 Tax=Oleiharenicola lentus TaxID=2508720 RepID=UPI003F6629E1
MLRTVIIDDESLARDELRRLLAAHPEVSIVGEAGKISAARELLARGGYDLVLLDIQLAGGSGFDLVPHVVPPVEIIFVTAHDQFAVRAFEINALDYVLKPVSPARLATALKRVSHSNAASSPGPTPEEASTTAPFAANDRVFLKSDRGSRFVSLTEIAAVIANDNYTDVYVADGAHFLVRRTLKSWESSLPGAHFTRVHRQALVNLAQVERIDHADGETPALHLRGVKRPVTCSHRLSPELRRRLG